MVRKKGPNPELESDGLAAAKRRDGALKWLETETNGFVLRADYGGYGGYEGGYGARAAPRGKGTAVLRPHPHPRPELTSLESRFTQVALSAENLSMAPRSVHVEPLGAFPM